MSGHDDDIYAAYIDGKPQSYIDPHGSQECEGGMLDIAKRLRQRIEELGLTQVEVARATGFSPGRLANYLNLSERHNRTPDVHSLAKLAKVLQTTTDWLLGSSESRPVDVAAVIQRLLEIDGMPSARAEVLAQAAARAVQLLSTLPGDGDAQARIHLAAQASWQTRPQTKPS